MRETSQLQVWPIYFLFQKDYAMHADLAPLGRTCFVQLLSIFESDEQKWKSSVKYIFGVLVYENVAVLKRHSAQRSR